MDPAHSTEFAEHVRNCLINKNQTDITEVMLSELVIQELDYQNFKKVSDYYSIWHQIKTQNLGIVILIGGVTGIGKSTVAKEVSYRLGINNSIGTDSIRQVMRKTISPELIPELHESTFAAHKHIDIHPMLSNVIVGFEHQSRLVSVGIDGICERSRTKGVNFVIEGIHLVPGFYTKAPNVFPYILHLDDIKAHEHRINSRGEHNEHRQPERYLEQFENIINIQRYIKTQAKEHDIPIIENTNIEESINTIIERTVEGIRTIVELKANSDHPALP